MALLGYFCFTLNSPEMNKYNIPLLSRYPYTYLEEHTMEVDDVPRRELISGAYSFFPQLAERDLASPCYTMYYYYKHNMMTEFQFILGEVFYGPSAQSYLATYMLRLENFSKEVIQFLRKNIPDGEKLLQRMNKYRAQVLRSQNILKEYDEKEVKSMKTKLTLTAIATRGITPSDGNDVYDSMHDKIMHETESTSLKPASKYDMVVICPVDKLAGKQIQLMAMDADDPMVKEPGFTYVRLSDIKDHELFYILSAPVVRTSKYGVSPVFKAAEEGIPTFIADEIKLQDIDENIAVTMYPGFPNVQATRPLRSFYGARYNIYFKSAVWNREYIERDFETYRKIVLGILTDDDSSEVEASLAEGKPATAGEKPYETSDTLMGIASLLGD